MAAPWQCTSSGSVAEGLGTMRWRRDDAGAKTPNLWWARARWRVAFLREAVVIGG